jgi:formate C-acetyltransferase
MQRKGSFIADQNPFERDVALYRVPEGLSMVQTRARHLLEVVRCATSWIPEDWTIGGEHLAHEFGFNNPNNCSKVDRLAALGVDPSCARAIEDRVHCWCTRHKRFSTVGPVPSEMLKGQAGDNWVGTFAFTAGGWSENHSIRDYARVLAEGFSGIRGRVEELMRRADPSEPQLPVQMSFWQAALWVCEAGKLLGARYAELARSMGREEIAAACAHVPALGARTLREAVQALWLAHVLTGGEDGINANSLGRLDQIFYPYYRADLEADRITREEAVDLMEELACKLYLDYDVQAITIGGLDTEGNDATNDMSEIILEATGRLDFPRDLSVRIAPSTPRGFVERCAVLTARGGGIPFYFNDAAFVKAMSDRGIPIEDARGYAPIGCVELTIPGKANPHAVSGYLNAAKGLEMALFDGVDPATGERLGLATGTLADHSSYESFRDAVWAQVEHFAKLMIYGINRGELAQREAGPLPYLSLLTEDCIERGRDLTDGGARYLYHSVCFMGTANVADSLMAVKRLVYEEGRIGAKALLEALQANFEGHEPLRQLLLNGAPKYGNDVGEVDEIAAWIAGRFIDLMDCMRSPLGGRFFVHLFSFTSNVSFGRCLGATPDGRKEGEPLAYSLSAQQGRDSSGVTALLSSLSRLPHNRAGGASAAIVDFDPVVLQGGEGVRRLTDLILSSFGMGVGQLQFNVVTVERLRQAQADPERYGNLSVRVAGYSQKFRLLTAEIQEMVIARTKHRK